jgi:uncharacterized membrane protein YozB (DUF420 family)
MSGLLSTYAPLWSDVNLILQLVILAALGGGAVIVKRKQLARHGYVMAACVALNTVSIFLVMAPVALGLLGGGQLTRLTGLTALHVAIGVAVEAAAVYLVSVWRFRKPGPTCLRYKRWMRALAGAWAFEAALGVLIYVMLYV